MLLHNSTPPAPDPACGAENKHILYLDSDCELLQFIKSLEACVQIEVDRNGSDEHFPKLRNNCLICGGGMVTT